MLSVPELAPCPAFPVPLVCPGCGAPLRPHGTCSCPAGTRLEVWHGLPRTLFGQSFWGECGQEKMAEVLAGMERTPWREALRQAAGDEAVYQHLISGIGADFLYSMPWDRIETVLDIGAGMGFMTAPMAAFAKRIVALEAVPERALFLARRARQDRLNNVFPLIANGAALPFAPESFDLVTLNGVFEYIGLWGDGDPQRLQQEFLARVHRILRPGGFLYIGIETRYGFGNWLGRRDHSGLRFTSLMPRAVADWYCRRRQVPIYGSQDAPRGYRTYTHTPRRYQAMFRAAGFASVEVHGCFDGYNRQLGLYPLTDAPARAEVHRVLDPAGSWLGALRRVVTGSRLLHATLVPEVVVFGCKAPTDGPLAWSGLEGSEPLAQVNTNDKVAVLRFIAGRPVTIARAGKTPASRRLLEHEHNFLDRLQARFGPQARTLPLRWPVPVRRLRCNGLVFHESEYVQGTLLSEQLLPRRHRPTRFRRMLADLCDRYLTLCRRLGEGADRPAAEDHLDALAALDIGDAVVQRRIESACLRMRQRGWPTGPVHGDLALSNTIRLPDGALVLIDWEHATEVGSPALDLVRLFRDVSTEEGLLRPAVRARALADARAVVAAALATLGFGAADLADLEVLFLADQYRLLQERGACPASLLRAYHERTFALSPEGRA
jgi:SAM-dependent methyltransferase